MRSISVLVTLAVGACALFPDVSDLMIGANADATAESGSQTATIQCGDGLTTCSAPSTICCNVCVLDDAGLCTSAQHDVSCIAADAGSTCNDHSGGPNAIPCSDPSACAAEGHPGAVCCGVLAGSIPDDSQGYMASISCMSLDGCKAHVSGTTQSYDILCDPHASDPCGGANGAPDASCIPSVAAPAFSRCE